VRAELESELKANPICARVAGEYTIPNRIAKIHTDRTTIYTKNAWNPSDSEKSEMQDFVDT
jgi:hypothetical protein